MHGNIFLNFAVVLQNAIQVIAIKGYCLSVTFAAVWQGFAPTEHSDQPGHPSSQSSLCGQWVAKSMWTVKTSITSDTCPG